MHSSELEGLLRCAFRQQHRNAKWAEDSHHECICSTSFSQTHGTIVSFATKLHEIWMFYKRGRLLSFHSQNYCCLQLHQTGPSQRVMSKGWAASFSCQTVAELLRAAGWAMGDRLSNRRARAAHREGLPFPLLSGCKCYLRVLICTDSPPQGAIFLM